MYLYYIFEKYIHFLRTKWQASFLDSRTRLSFSKKTLYLFFLQCFSNLKASQLFSLYPTGKASYKQVQCVSLFLYFWIFWLRGRYEQDTFILFTVSISKQMMSQQFLSCGPIHRERESCPRRYGHPTTSFSFRG